MNRSFVVYIILSLVAQSNRMLAASAAAYQNLAKQVPIEISDQFSSYWREHLQGKAINLDTREYFSGKTLRTLQEEHPEEPLIVGLVLADRPDLFGINGVHVYEAHRLNRHILTVQETDSAIPDLEILGTVKMIRGPQGEPIRGVATTNLGWGRVKTEAVETCYLILHPGSNSFSFCTSFSHLLERQDARSYLQSFNHEPVKYESFSNIENGSVPLNNGQSLELGAHKKLPTSHYAKMIAFTAFASFLHGVWNNWLGRRAHEDNTWFLKAPKREWGTAIFCNLFQTGLMFKLFNMLALMRSKNGKLSATLSILASSGAQMLGEVIPLPGKPGFRSLAMNLRPLGLLQLVS